MKAGMKRTSVVFLLAAACVLTMALAAGAADLPKELEEARQALAGAMGEVGLSKGDPNLLLLTNAGYGSIGGLSTEAFVDTASHETGCSAGKRSLLAVHTSITEPLWCSVYRKDTGKLAFLKWTGKGFDRQVIDASPERILCPEGWKAAASGLMGPRAFSVISISLTWAVAPPWPLLQAATFHDHFCPGLNSGYMAGLYLMKNMPLSPGQRYVFVTAPGKCAADALQVLFNTTAGKGSGYSMAIGGPSLKTYAKEGVPPSLVAMRVDNKADTCEGRVLGFDWQKAYATTGVKAEEMAPEGGRGNPMFWIARARMSRALAAQPESQLLGYIAELKSFSGKAGLADRVAGGDPYAVAFQQ